MSSGWRCEIHRLHLCVPKLVSYAPTVMITHARLEMSMCGRTCPSLALVEQGGSITRSGWRVHWQKSYRQPWTPYTRKGKGQEGIRQSASVASAAPPARSGGSTTPSPTAPHTDAWGLVSLVTRNMVNAHVTRNVGGHIPPPKNAGTDVIGSIGALAHGLPFTGGPGMWIGMTANRVSRIPRHLQPRPCGLMPSHSNATTSNYAYPSLTSPRTHSLLPFPGNGQQGSVVPLPPPPSTSPFAKLTTFARMTFFHTQEPPVSLTPATDCVFALPRRQ